MPETTIIGDDAIEVGDKIRFIPRAGGHKWWTVQARDERYIIATQQAPFRPKGEQIYTIVDLVGPAFGYNGIRPGPIRSSSNHLGGGWDEGWPELLAELQAGTVQLSHRRMAAVDEIITQKEDQAPVGSFGEELET